MGWVLIKHSCMQCRFIYKLMHSIEKVTIKGKAKNQGKSQKSVQQALLTAKMKRSIITIESEIIEIVATKILFLQRNFLGVSKASSESKTGWS